MLKRTVLGCTLVSLLCLVELLVGAFFFAMLMLANNPYITPALLCMTVYCCYRFVLHLWILIEAPKRRNGWRPKALLYGTFTLNALALAGFAYSFVMQRDEEDDWLQMIGWLFLFSLPSLLGVPECSLYSSKSSSVSSSNFFLRHLSPWIEAEAEAKFDIEEDISFEPISLTEKPRTNENEASAL